MRRWWIALSGTLLSALAEAQPAQPIIDVHRHASWPGEDDAAPRTEMLREMDSEGVVLALLHTNEPSDVQAWLRAAPGRFVGGPAMPCSTSHREPFFRCFP